MRRWVAIGIGALLLLWVPFLYWQLRVPPAAQPAPVPDSAPPPAPVERPAAAAATPRAVPPATEPEPQPATPADPQAAPASQAPASDPETLAAIQAAYANSSRDGRAGAVEADLRSSFERSGAPADMLRSLSCHAAACKIEMSWSPERARTFTLVTLAWTARVDGKLAAQPGAPDRDGLIPITLYLTRTRDPEADQGAATR